MEWGLTMTQRETEAVIEMVETCEEPIEVEAGRADGSSSLLPERNTSATTAAPTFVPEMEPQANNTVYESCEEAIEAGESRGAGERGWRERVPEGIGSQRQRRGWGWCCL